MVGGAGAWVATLQRARLRSNLILTVAGAVVVLALLLFSGSR